MKKQQLLALSLGAVAFVASATALAADGFYGGIALRDNGAESNGIVLGRLSSVWNRYSAPASDDSMARTLVFGGYRWKNDVAVEAAFNTRDQYALHPGSIAGTGGVGIGLTDVLNRAWNADVYTSWEFIRSLSLYGRLGYAQTDNRALFAGASLVPGDTQRLRDGVNYGVGLRYAMTEALGLRVEYARFSRFNAEIAGGLPDSDQVSIGVQLKF